ncbi:hypothetical protein K2V61_12650 [Staphylococcus simulans]|uniref:hypothetical protein n=1 Tax=Staphylococcus simulans TaxID=1286 RepID=UPI001E2DD3D3|nr:hypothetical protein [Staphylococcus simulans]MCD8916389.1 hypothetical protein [Staphylococcus simulans]
MLSVKNTQTSYNAMKEWAKNNSKEFYDLENVFKFEMVKNSYIVYSKNNGNSLNMRVFKKRGKEFARIGNEPSYKWLIKDVKKFEA